MATFDMKEFKSNLSGDKWERVEEVRKWVESDAGFYGRKDDDFLLIFLRFCDYDVESVKKAMISYYENRVKYPLWWADRDAKSTSMQQLLQSKFATLVKFKNANLPSIAIARFAKVSTDSNRMDDWCKLVSVMMEITMRRGECQLNGEIVIVDLNNLPLWMAWKAIWPPLCRDVLNAFVYSLPIQVKSFIILNCPNICLPIINSFILLLSQTWKQKLHCFGSNWSKLGELVPLEALPEEYGGSAGPISEHEDAFLEEILLYNDYLVEDNQFGFQNK